MSRSRGPRSAALLLLGFVGPACTVAQPPVTEYLLEPAELAPPPPEEQGPVLRLRALSVRPFLDQHGVAFRRGDVRAGAYRYHRWAEPVPEMVERVILKSFRQSGHFRAVLDPYSNGAADLEVEVELLGLHEETRPSGLVAVVELAAQREVGGVPERLERRVEVPAGEAGVQDTVRSLRSALLELLGEVADWLASS